jgi:TolB protein
MGRHIAYTSWRTGNRDIFIQSLDDTSDAAAVNLTDSPGVQEDGAAFSPNGRFLAYSDDQAGFPVISAQPLAEDSTPDGLPVSLGHQGSRPAWSPDSQSLVYVHEKNGRTYLITGSAEAWGITPEVYTAVGLLENPSWAAVDLSPVMAGSLENIDGIVTEKPLFVEALARPEKNKPPVVLFEMPVNAPSPYLSDEVDQSFTALRERVIAEAGWDFLGQLDGMFEALDVGPLPGQSAESWNKAGRAFDLYYREALGLDPQVIVTREEEGSQLYWRVYVRTAVQDGSQGEPLKMINWDFQSRSGDDPQYYEQGGKLGETVPAGYYIDFTALAASYGWNRVPANESWRTYFPDIQFWHFENRQNLTWLEAMQQLYSEVELGANQ